MDDDRQLDWAGALRAWLMATTAECMMVRLELYKGCIGVT